jgi:hypothetical protein
MTAQITIRGARLHNLKNVTLTENRARKPWAFMPGMKRRSFDGGREGGELVF